MSDVTRILSAIDHGDPAAAEQLLPLVYEELRRLAAARLATQRPEPALEATELVHEAYVRLVDQPAAQQWNSRGHFFAAAAEAMRRILVDHARASSSLKRGGKRKRLDLEQIDLAKTPVGEELLAFNDALSALQVADAAAGQLVQLRYFAGLSVEEAASAMGIPRSTAYDHWTFARAWLRCRLREEND